MWVSTVEPPPTGGVRGGRQPVTTKADISHVAFQLFATHGYDETTVDQIAKAVGIGRRTLFRYFSSKNDIAWGDFDDMLEHFRETLQTVDPELPLVDTLQQAVVEFNTFPDEEILYHRERLTMLLTVPSLVGHSTLRYAGWRMVIQEFVAKRLECSPEDLAPRTVAWLCLGLALAAYEQWLADPGSRLPDLLTDTFSVLGSLAEARGVSLTGFSSG